MQQPRQPDDEILVFYRKENLFIYPSKSESIAGRLSILQEKGIAYLVWEPYSTEPSYPGAGSSQLLYSFKVPLTKLRALKRYIPAFGYGHVTVLLEDGVAFPPFYFIHGGVHEFLTAVKDQLPLNRSSADGDLFLIDEQSLKLSHSMDTLLPEVKEAKKPVLPIRTKTMTDRLNEASWSLLENFARMANFSLTAKAPAPPPQTLASQRDADDFEVISPAKSNSSEAMPLPTCPPPLPRGPVSLEVWKSQFAEDGSCSPTNERVLRSRIFTDGLEPSLRKEAWKLLLGYGSWAMTTDQRNKYYEDKRREYAVYKTQWTSVTEEQLSHFAKLRDRQSRIDRDVVRTDRLSAYFSGDDNPNLKKLNDILLTYAIFNWDIGYVQGMNDLLVPILMIMDDEVDAFWCFKGLMDQYMGNFHKDQVAMTSQLASIAHILKYLDPILHRSLEETDSVNMFFCFRWILLQFKREFSPEEIYTIWDTFLARSETDHFHLFFAVAVIESLRDKIIGERMKFDELLRHVNELSGKLDVKVLLPKAMLYYRRFMDSAPADLQAKLRVAQHP